MQPFPQTVFPPQPGPFMAQYVPPGQQYPPVTVPPQNPPPSFGPNNPFVQPPPPQGNDNVYFTIISIKIVSGMVPSIACMRSVSFGISPLFSAKKKKKIDLD
jgi:hypothetical protein